MFLRTSLAIATAGALLMSACTPSLAYPTGVFGADGSTGAAMTGSWSTMQRVQTDPTMTFFDANVVILGDSITVGSYAGLIPLLERKGYKVRVDANSSIPTLPSVERLAEYLEARMAAGKGGPRVVIAALGTNDTVPGPYQGPTKVQGQVERVRRLMNATGSTTNRLIWVNVYANSVHTSSRSAGVNLPTSRYINNRLLMAKAPNGKPAITRIIDWYGFLAASPYRQRTYLRDGVHTTTLGSNARNALIASYL